MNNDTGACRVDFDNTVTFSVSVTLEDCTNAKQLRCVMYIVYHGVYTILSPAPKTTI